MLTEAEESYLQKIPSDKTVCIKPYDPSIISAVELLKNKLIQCGVRNRLLWIGASALGIAGQNDIDFHVISKKEEWDELSLLVSEIFGPRVPNISIYKWELTIDGFDVELYLSDSESSGMKVQIEVFDILSSSERLRRDYEKLKVGSDGISFRDYMRRKYEFFHKILGR